MTTCCVELPDVASMTVQGDFATNTEGKVETTLTTNEFDIGLSSNSGGGNHSNGSYNAKSKSSTNSSDSGWTYTSEYDSTYDETAGSNSGGNFGIEFSLSKTTGADEPTGSLDLTFYGTRINRRFDFSKIEHQIYFHFLARHLALLTGSQWLHWVEWS